MASAKKAAEAAEHILQAEKLWDCKLSGCWITVVYDLIDDCFFFSLKTSFLKWKPDFELAADSYERAATCYKTAKDLPKCRDCHYKAVDCYKQTKSYPLFHHITTHIYLSYIWKLYVLLITILIGICW